IIQLKLRIGGSEGSITDDPYVIVGSTRIDYLASSGIPVQEMIGGGVRIKAIIFKNTSSTFSAEKKITYQYKDENNINLSSGVIDAKQDKLERNYTLNTSKYLFATEFNNPSSFSGRQIKYDVTEKGVNVDLTQGSYVGYRSVKISEENNGYSIYSFTSPYDYPSAMES